jgi:hypothetical protein
MLYRFSIITFGLLILAVAAVEAQVNKPLAGFCIETNAMTGKVIKHTEKFRLPVPDQSTALDVNLQWKTYGKKQWHQRRRYPIIGIAFAYTNYGIDSLYGRCYSIYPNIEIPIITGNKIEWTVRIGNGAGYVSKKYQRRTPVDTLNNAISSHINDYASFLTDVRYRVSDNWEIQTGLNFSHISNASYRQPNLGINMWGGHIGLKYYPVTSKPVNINHQLANMPNRWLAQFRLTMAYNQSNAPLGPSYPIYLATIMASKRWISKNKLFFGLDYSYHQQIYAFLRNNSFVEPGTEYQNSYKTAVLAGNEFLLGRLGVVLQTGYYLRQAYQTQGKFYQKIGGNYYLTQREHGPIKEAYLCAFLKTHISTAELAEFGFGMSF